VVTGTADGPTLVLRDVRLLEADGAHDVGMRDGLIVAVAPAGSLTGTEVIDAGGRLCTAAFVDGHCHLDKSFLWDLPGFTGKVAGAFFDELGRFKATTSSDSVMERMRRAVQAAALNGTGTMRAQIDVDDVIGLAHLEAALALRDECAPYLRLQVVVFPQEGVVGNPAAGEIVEEALRLGADVMGGAHGFDRKATSEAHYSACFALAERFGVDLDLHLDFDATPEWPLQDWDVWQVARLTAAHGWQGRVTVAHLTQHGLLDAAGRRALANLLLEHDISLAVVPGAELHGARFWTDSPATDVATATADYADLVRSGVRLSYAGGHLADAFHPFGEGDLLRDGLLLAAARNLGDPSIGGTHVLSLSTSVAAKSAGLPGPHGIAVGALADCTVFDAPDADTALRHQADRWLVVHSGRPVATTRTIKELLT
jgi:cytosine/creatinine deaminase